MLPGATAEAAGGAYPAKGNRIEAVTPTGKVAGFWCRRDYPPRRRLGPVPGVSARQRVVILKYGEPGGLQEGVGYFAG